MNPAPLLDPDEAALETAVRWASQGEAVTVATVVATFGTAPRPVGSVAFFRGDGVQVGSVSGGCVEDDLAEAIRAGQIVRPALRHYGMDQADAVRWGLPCGGRLSIALEPAVPQAHLADWRERLAAGRLVRRSVRLGEAPQLADAAGSPATTGQADFTAWPDGFSATYGPRHRLLVIGANQISAALLPMATLLGYRVTLCDPRPEARAAWGDLQALGGSSAAELSSEMPDDAVTTFRPDPRSAIVALSHDPKLDDLALLEALRSPAFYVGALGSRRNQQLRRARLMEHFAFSEAELARLHGPIGLPLNSRTPAEIAVAIAAELVAVRRGTARQMDAAAQAGHARAAASECGTDDTLMRQGTNPPPTEGAGIAVVATAFQSPLPRCGIRS